MLTEISQYALLKNYEGVLNKIENCSDEETPHQRWEALCLSV